MIGFKLVVILKELISKIKNISCIIIESIWFSFAISLVTVINFSFGLGILSYIIALVVIIVIISTNARFFCLPNIFLLVLGGGLTEVPNTISFGLIIVFALILIMIFLLVRHIVINRKQLIPSILSNSFIWTTLGLIVVMMLSLITSVKPIRTLLAIGGFAINILVIFVSLCFIPNNEVSKKKLGYSFVFLTIVIFLMALITFFKIIPQNSIKEIMFLKKLDFKWADSNHYIVMANFGALFAAYLLIYYFKNLTVNDKLLFFLTIFLCVFLNIFLLARGSLFGLISALLTGIIYIFIIKRSWRKNLVLITSIIIFLCVGIILTLYEIGALDELIEHYKSLQSPLNGREELWKVAWKHFKRNWFLGTGYGTSRIFILAETSDTVYNYHNYFFQISTCGILGIIAFALYLINVAWHLHKKTDPYSILFSSIFVMFLTNGLIDTLFFSNKIMPLFSICLCFLDKKEIG